MLSYNNELSAKEYCNLRSMVGWTQLIEEQAQSGLDHSDFVIACREGNKIIGCARIFWDGGYIAYLADVIVSPEYQNQGIGKKLVKECISYVDSQLKPNWRIKIVIVATKGKEEFYEKIGFIRRPNEDEGAGMQMWRK